ncbi:MAG: LytTR family DNA-binding domain-containing protein [Pararhodobacter sp.]
MTDNALHLALRDLQQALSNPAYWAISAAIAVVLGVSGPFDTYETMPVGARLAYWAAVVLTTGPTGWLIGSWVVIAFDARGRPVWAAMLVAGAVVGAAVTLVVHLINVLGRGEALWSWQGLAAQVPATPLIGLVMTAAVIWTHLHAAKRAPVAAPVATQRPAPAIAPAPAARLLARLPLKKRGALIALSVQDHYVDVFTTSGHEMLLMRLADAIAEAEGCPGVQVHRSHWVALDQVRAARREAARGVLTLSDGREVPVSRGYLPKAKEAGLF